jgi:hypothetical protein
MRLEKFLSPTWVRGSPPASRRLVVTPRLLELTTAWLRESSAGRRESTVLWAGRPNGSALVVVSHLIEPDYNAFALRMNVPVTDRARVLELLRVEDVAVVADLHTHPLEAFLSPIDQAHPYSARIGHIAIVLPRYGLDEGTEGWKAYEYRRTHWQELEVGTLLDVRSL